MASGRETHWLNFATENWISKTEVESDGMRKFGSVVHKRKVLEEIFEVEVSNSKVEIFIGE
jgi:hypothetical protein